ncbi:substrate-binding periplasmic protein [Kiloniella sp.]|uniref:substrate-binding periplasmic protein n=1 Tax=Kiloniella sp. TaxID=1938587 RepID=UPI003B02776F
MFLNWFSRIPVLALLTIIGTGVNQGFALDEKENLKATTLHYPPYEFEFNGIPAGIAVDILQEATRRVGLSGVDITFFPWKRAVFATETGKMDVLFNAGVNEARKKWGLYSKHTLIMQEYFLFTRRGENIATTMNFDNVADKNIAVRRGYLYGSGPFKRAITTDNAFQRVALSESTENSVRLLLGNRIDMFVGDYLPVMHYIINNDLTNKIELVKVSGSDEKLKVLVWPTYFLFSKLSVDKEFVTRFDSILKQMIEDGTYKKIHDKYNAIYGSAQE